MWLRQSTAGQVCWFGPFLSESDGITPLTGLVIANTDIKLAKHNAIADVVKAAGGATHNASGRYYATFDAVDTDTLGRLEVNVHKTGALPVRREYMVLPQDTYDLMLSDGILDAIAASVVAGMGGNPLAGIIEVANAGEGLPAVTLKEGMQLILSFMLGLTTGGGTSNIVFRDINNARNCISLTTDSKANRLTVTRVTG